MDPETGLAVNKEKAYHVIYNTFCSATIFCALFATTILADAILFTTFTYVIDRALKSMHKQTFVSCWICIFLKPKGKVPGTCYSGARISRLKTSSALQSRNSEVAAIGPELMIPRRIMRLSIYLLLQPPVPAYAGTEGCSILRMFFFFFLFNE